MKKKDEIELLKKQVQELKKEINDKDIKKEQRNLDGLLMLLIEFDNHSIELEYNGGMSNYTVEFSIRTLIIK